MPAATLLPDTAAQVQLEYQINNNGLEGTLRVVDACATDEELKSFEAEGFLLRPAFFQGADLEALRAGVEAVAGAELRRRATVPCGSKRFGGLFVRQLMDLHPAFHLFLDCAPLIGVARAMLGPQVWIRDTVARVTQPGDPNQETEWHFHQRVAPQPMPPWFPFPHIVDALVYLDDLDDATGPLCVVPGTHKQIHERVVAECYGELPGQVKLNLPAGSVVFIHGNLWHRAMPTLPEGSRRRLVIVGFAPPWMKAPPHGHVRPDGLLVRLAEQAGPERRELLGCDGYF